VQEITLADGAELAVAEEACQAHRAEALLDQFSVMIGLPKKALAAAVATAETSTVEWRLLETLTRALQQDLQVFGSGGGRASLELNGLALARQGANGDAA
jgi:hypothetical protein